MSRYLRVFLLWGKCLVSSNYFVLSSKYFKPYLLYPNQKCVIGRSKENEICLSFSTLSRRHTQIRITSDGKAFLQDLESRNGTYLNGTLIHEENPLRSGDHLRIGDVTILFQEQTEIKEATNPNEQTSTSISDMCFRLNQSSEAMMGNLRHMTMLEVFTTLNYFEKTGTLQIRHGAQQGKILFASGEIYQAFFDQLQGLSAVYEILSMKEGLFEFKSQTQLDGKKDVQLTIQQIMMNYAHQLDESSQTQAFEQTDFYPQAESLDPDKKTQKQQPPKK
jgi:pSer/pThr/pTyr-binding forkhead associated (FHA) protein